MFASQHQAAPGVGPGPQPSGPHQQSQQQNQQNQQQQQQQPGQPQHHINPAQQPGGPLVAPQMNALAHQMPGRLGTDIGDGSDHKDAAGAVAAAGLPDRPGTGTGDEKVYQWIFELMHGPNREQALLELGKKREQYEELAVILWHSFGVMTCLLQEIIAVYPLLSPPQLSSTASNRVCNALALLQCVASHNDTRNLFLNAHIPLFLYPFLNTSSKTRAFEYLRLTSLGVIGALVKNDSAEVISFLLSTEIIPLCLRIMESGTELSKTVAIFIVQKILMDDTGLAYVCQTYERFFAVSAVLANMVTQLVDLPPSSSRLLKHVVRCYLRLSDNPRAREALRQILPEPLRDGTFSQTLRDDAGTKRCLAQLLVNLADTYD